MVIYVDVLLVVNFIISYLLLLAASLLAGYTYKRKRIIAGAVTGALCCLYIFVQTDNVFVNLAVKVFSLAVCSAVAFGWHNKKKFVMQTVCYLFLNMLVTGLLTALSFKSTTIYHNNMFFYFRINPILLVLCSLVIYILLLISECIKDKISPHKTYNMTIVLDTFILKNIPAFYDSGFSLKDIVSNKDVVIVALSKVKKEIPQGILNNIEGFINQDYQNVDCSFVPVFFNTISGNGMLPALKADCIHIGSKKIENVLIAFTDNNLSENVTALFGTSIRRQV